MVCTREHHKRSERQRTAEVSRSLGAGVLIAPFVWLLQVKLGIGPWWALGTCIAGLLGGVAIADNRAAAIRCQCCCNSPHPSTADGTEPRSELGSWDYEPIAARPVTKPRRVALWLSFACLAMALAALAA